MKKIHTIIAYLSIGFYIYAQNAYMASNNIQTVVNTFISMRNAVSLNDTTAMKQSVLQLQEYNIEYFSELHCLDSIQQSLNGHLIFDAVFIDRLIQGENVYQRADEIEGNRTKIERGQTTGSSIRTKTCFVKAGHSTKYTFSSNGHLDLAVVAEAGGLVTLKIHVTNRDGFDKRYDDTKNVKIGLPHRQVSIDLPENRRNIIELEIINCGNKDCSFVIISN